jgi:hypothetical protein
MKAFLKISKMAANTPLLIKQSYSLTKRNLRAKRVVSAAQKSLSFTIKIQQG